ncbi:MAG TPA: methyltransferase [Mycobacterium sp.]|nr:methyltransferase [Mycobacterium sp.]
MAEKPPRIPPLALVRAIDTARAGLQRLHRSLAPGAINLLELLTAGWMTQMVYVAVKLGIPDALADGPLPANEVAHRVGAHPDAVYRLMRALASKGVLRHRRDGKFTLTSIGKGLRTGTPGSLRDLALFIGHPLRWEDWGNLLYSVQTGEPSVVKLRGKPFFEYLDSNPDLAESFNNAMTAGSEFATHAVLASYDFSGYRTIIDVGGGHGRLLSMILGKAPNASGVLFDMPAVVDSAGPELTKAGVADRCQVVGGSFFESVPDGGDAYIMKAILHDWNDDAAVKILGNVRTAIASDGKLLLLESVLPERSSSDIGMLIDIEMLVAVGGKERTRAEWTSLLRRAGFQLNRVVETATGVSIIEATPA